MPKLALALSTKYIEPIVSLFCAHMIGELTPLLSLGLETLTKPCCPTGAEIVGLGWYRASGSAILCGECYEPKQP